MNQVTKSNSSKSNSNFVSSEKSRQKMKQRNWGFPAPELLKSAMAAGETAMRNRKRVDKLHEVNKVFYRKAIELLQPFVETTEHLEFLASRMTDFYPGNRLSHEFIWIHEAIKNGRNWSAVPAQFYHKGFQVQLTKWEAKDLINVKFAEFSEIPLTSENFLKVCGPYFTSEERSAYLENTGEKLSYLTSYVMLKFVQECMKSEIVTEEFIKSITHKFESIKSKGVSEG